MDAACPSYGFFIARLNLRREHPEWFGAEADYTPLMVAGRRADHVIAFLRAGTMPQLFRDGMLKLAGNWSGTTVDLPNGRWKNLLTGDVLTGGIVPDADDPAAISVALLQLEGDLSDASV